MDRRPPAPWNPSGRPRRRHQTSGAPAPRCRGRTRALLVGGGRCSGSHAAHWSGFPDDFRPAGHERPPPDPLEAPPPQDLHPPGSREGRPGPFRVRGGIRLGSSGGRPSRQPHQRLPPGSDVFTRVPRLGDTDRPLHLLGVYSGAEVGSQHRPCSCMNPGGCSQEPRTPRGLSARTPGRRGAGCPAATARPSLVPAPRVWFRRWAHGGRPSGPHTGTAIPAGGAEWALHSPPTAVYAAPQPTGAGRPHGAGQAAAFHARGAYVTLLRPPLYAAAATPDGHSPSAVTSSLEVQAHSAESQSPGGARLQAARSSEERRVTGHRGDGRGEHQL